MSADFASQNDIRGVRRKTRRVKHNNGFAWRAALRGKQVAGPAQFGDKL